MLDINCVSNYYPTSILTDGWYSLIKYGGADHAVLGRIPWDRSFSARFNIDFSRSSGQVEKIHVMVRSLIAALKLEDSVYCEETPLAELYGLPAVAIREIMLNTIQTCFRN